MRIPDSVLPPHYFAGPAQDPDLTVSIRDHGDVVVLEVGGEVDMCTASLLRDAVHRSLHGHPRLLVLDLLAVRFFGSAGLALLIEAQQLAQEQVRLRVVANGTTTLHPLHVTGLDRQFALYATREDALRDH